MYPKILQANPPGTLSELFIRPSRWVQQYAAKNAARAVVEPDSAEATAWCLSSGLELIYPEEIREEIETRLLAWINAQLPDDAQDLPEGRFDSLIGWNDMNGRSFSHIRRACLGAGV